jgi:hypothetical protein
MTTDETITITLDAEAARVLQAAVDLYQRVAMGQWGEVAEVADEMLADDSRGLFGPASAHLMEVRCAHADHPALRASPSAYLSIRQASHRAQVAGDIWVALRSGKSGEDLIDYPLTDTYIRIERGAPGPQEPSRNG